MNRFCQAVTALDGVSVEDCRDGLRALGPDSSRIRAQRARALSGSVNLDAALRGQYPNESRWDYGIGYRLGKDEVAVWVEVHPAGTSNVEEVLRKLDWLKARLAEAPELNALTVRTDKPFRWVASGSISISANSPQARRLGISDLEPPCKVLRLP